MNYYTPTGRPIDGVLSWARMFGDQEQGTGLPDTRRIGDTQVGPIRVSTVWLGLDHSFGMGPPLIFETMVFAPRVTGFSELACYRHSTIEQAVDGHWSVVRRVRKRWPLLLLGALVQRVKKEMKWR